MEKILKFIEGFMVVNELVGSNINKIKPYRDGSRRLLFIYREHKLYFIVIRDKDHYIVRCLDTRLSEYLREKYGSNVIEFKNEDDAIDFIGFLLELEGRDLWAMAVMGEDWKKLV